MVWESISSVIQAIATVVLVVVTIFYAFRTHTIATATKTMADETASMAKLESERQRDAVRPVLMFDVRSESSLSERSPLGSYSIFDKVAFIQLVNGGTGPALEVRIRWSAKEASFHNGPSFPAADLVPIPQPCSLSVGASVNLQLNWRSILLASCTPEEQIFDNDYRERFITLGTVRVSYQDLHSRTVNSSGNIDLLLLDDPNGLLLRVSSFDHSVADKEVLANLKN